MDAFDRCKATGQGSRAWPGRASVRVNKAGCLDRCAGGPVAVVYPEAVWYTYVDMRATSKKSSTRTCKNGQVVERLLVTPNHLENRPLTAYCSRIFISY